MARCRWFVYHAKKLFCWSLPGAIWGQYRRNFSNSANACSGNGTLYGLCIFIFSAGIDQTASSKFIAPHLAWRNSPRRRAGHRWGHARQCHLPMHSKRSRQYGSSGGGRFQQVLVLSFKFRISTTLKVMLGVSCFWDFIIPPAIPLIRGCFA